MPPARKSLIHLAASALLLAAATAAHADLPSDVESARMNARAGGPTNPHDAELLKRWGATTNHPTRRATPQRSHFKAKHHRARNNH